MSNTSSHLASLGVTLQQAREFVLHNLGNPKLIFDVAMSNKISSSMLAEIVANDVPGITGSLVEAFFSQAGLPGNSLREFAASDKSVTDYVFLSDLVQGNIYLYNPLTGDNKIIYSFNRQITDIAVDGDGNIYISEFSKILKFNIDDGTLVTLINQNGYYNSLAVKGDTVYAASSSNSMLLGFNSETGVLVSSQQLEGGVSAGDIAFIGEEVFRTSAFNGLLKHSLGAADSTTVSNQTSIDHFGLVATPSGDLRAFSWQGHVREIDANTGEVKPLPNVPLIGMNQLSGAAEALQVHLDAFL
jgi:outer membrane protein assembly factor BamB